MGQYGMVCTLILDGTRWYQGSPTRNRILCQLAGGMSRYASVPDRTGLNRHKNEETSEKKRGAGEGGGAWLAKIPMVAIRGPQRPSKGRQGLQVSVSSARGSLEREIKRGGEGKKKEGGEGDEEAIGWWKSGPRNRKLEIGMRSPLFHGFLKSQMHSETGSVGCIFTVQQPADGLAATFPSLLFFPSPALSLSKLPLVEEPEASATLRGPPRRPSDGHCQPQSPSLPSLFLSFPLSRPFVTSIPNQKAEAKLHRFAPVQLSTSRTT